METIFSNISGIVSEVGVSGFLLVMWAVMPILILVLMSGVFVSTQKNAKNNDKIFVKQIEGLNTTFATQLTGLAEAIITLSKQVQNPPLNLEDAIDYYYLVMNSHVMKKLRYLGGILEINSIHERSEQIKKNIGKEFGTITMQECHKLSKKITCAGDMGKIVQEVMDWKEYLFEIHYIFFRPVAPELSDLKKRELDHLKIKDIETHIYSMIDTIAEVIRERGENN